MLQHIYSAIVYLRVLIKDQLPTRVGDICSELTDLVAERQKGTLLVTVITMLRDLQATTAPPPSPSPQPFPQVAHPSCHPLPLLPKSLNFLSLTSTFLRDSGNDNWSLVKSCPQYFFILMATVWANFLNNDNIFPQCHWYQSAIQWSRWIHPKDWDMGWRSLSES